MQLPLLGVENKKSFRERFFAASTGLYRSLSYIIFCYVVGCSWAVVALAKSAAVGTPTFSLAPILAAYGVAALALTIFMYAFMKTIILALCAYGEWLCENAEENASVNPPEAPGSADH